MGGTGKDQETALLFLVIASGSGGRNVHAGRVIPDEESLDLGRPWAN